MYNPRRKFCGLPRRVLLTDTQGGVLADAGPSLPFYLDAKEQQLRGTEEQRNSASTISRYLLEKQIRLHFTANTQDQEKLKLL